MAQQKNQSKPNGHAGPLDRSNGHAPASTERGGIPVPRDHAASDDTRRASAAMDASTTAPGTVCEEYAEVAPSLLPGVFSELSPRPAATGEKKPEPIPGGEFPLPASPGEFVEEIHRRIDLFEVWLGLLREEDDKIRQRAVEKLTEMRYKGAAALAEEPQQFIFDMPRPKRD
jgi:hypothetical protein